MFRRTRRPEKLLRLAYISALVFIGIVAGLGLFVQSQYTSIEESVSEVLAGIGQQRVKVQQIVLLATDWGAVDQKVTPTEAAAKLELRAAIEDLERRHHSILKSLSDLEYNLWGVISVDVVGQVDLKAYRDLDERIQAFISTARQFLEPGLDSTSVHLKATSRRYSESILVVLSDLQEFYFDQRRQKFQSLRDLQLGAFLSIVFILLLVGFFVFYPIEVQVRQARQFSERSQREAERANRIKTEFLANISHEIRTPLGAILGYSDMVLCDLECSESIRAKTLSIKKSSAHLKSLIDEILDLSKIEAGSLDISHEQVNLIDLLLELSSIIQVRMREKGLNFSIEFIDAIPAVIVSDSIRITQILINLLSNAAKFTEEGYVRLQVSKQDLAAGRTEVCFTVHDTGCGIPRDNQGQLFQRFSQLNGSNLKRAAGTGLGLVLSKSLAELIGGNLYLVSSEPGRGSSFRFSLPCQVPAGTELVERFQDSSSDANEPLDLNWIRNSLVGYRLLLVEDGEDNQRIYRYFFELAGAEVISIWDGLRALEYASEHDDFDLILMDIQLPGMDGFTVAVELRRRHVEKPIIALTAHALREEKERCLEAGFSDYISKPVSIPYLIQSVLKFPSSQASQSAAEQAIYSKYHKEPIYHPMIVRFAESLSERLTELQSMLDARQYTDAAGQAHKLKGAALTYGYASLHELIVTLEGLLKELIKGKREPGGFHDLMDRLQLEARKIESGANELKDNFS